MKTKRFCKQCGKPVDKKNFGYEMCKGNPLDPNNVTCFCDFCVSNIMNAEITKMEDEEFQAKATTIN